MATYTAPIQLQLDPNPKSTELQPQQSIQIQSIQASCDRPTLTSASPYESPALKPTPFKTPKYTEQWEEVDLELAQYIDHVAISATSLEEKHSLLCQGIYNIMMTKFGMKRVASNQKKRKRTHERNLKDLRKKKDMAKKDLTQAKHHPGDEEAAHELSVKFHKLLRLHNKAKEDITEGQNELGNL